jgi:hypothetical protein
MAVGHLMPPESIVVVRHILTVGTSVPLRLGMFSGVQPQLGVLFKLDITRLTRPFQHSRRRHVHLLDVRIHCHRTDKLESTCWATERCLLRQPMVATMILQLL